MSPYSFIAEDDLTADHYPSHAYNGYTSFEYEILGLNPDVGLQIHVFPPLPSTKTIAPSLNLSPFPRSSSVAYPLIERPYSNAAYLNRHLCDLFTPSYEPKLPLWTPNGEIPDLDAGVCGVDCLQGLAKRFPRYGRLISAANPYNPRSVNKVKDLVLRYLKEERENSWDSTTVNPWQIEARDVLVQENGIPTSRTQTLKLFGTTDNVSDVKRILRKRGSLKQGIVPTMSKNRMRLCREKSACVD